MLLFTSLLTALVVFVNGWTDAPNSIAVAVSCGALRPRRALLLAALMEPLGLLVAIRLLPTVARTVLDLSSFAGNPARASLALAAALAAVALWAIIAWRWGLPTSESHGLLAALAGAAAAINGWLGVNWALWGRVLLALAGSLLLAAVAGRCFSRLLSARIPPPTRAFHLAQAICAAALAALHGAQDGQKFLAVFMLGWSLAQGVTASAFIIPLWLALLTGLLLMFGVACGGGRILRTLSRDLTTLTPAAGCGADLASGCTLLLSTLLGAPVSTTHIRVAAMAGAGEQSDPRVLRRMALVWLLTFPICGMLGFAFTKLLLLANL